MALHQQEAGEKEKEENTTTKGNESLARKDDVKNVFSESFTAQRLMRFYIFFFLYRADYRLRCGCFIFFSST